MNDAALKNGNQEKDTGITEDDKLKFEDHIYMRKQRWLK